VNPERLLLEWVSAAEGARFAEVVTALTERIRQLGPLGTECGGDIEALRFKLQAARAAVCGEKLRWVAAKQTEFVADGNKYGEVFTSQEIGRLLDGVIVEEIASQQILALLGEGALSVKELSQRLDLSPPDVMRHVRALVRKELIRMCRVRDRSPLYTTIETNA
jgi:DNA-binding transcriptional ArsR family regulator